MIDVQSLTFFAFAGLLLLSACGVVFARNTVNSVMFLILCFLCATVLWLMLQAEFLGLALLFVYVGAVMTLFLFVVMMLHVREDATKDRLLQYFPAVLVLGGLLVGMLWLAVGPDAFSIKHMGALTFAADYQNTQAIGEVLYTVYVVPLELAAGILLVAMVSAIALTFRGSQKRRVQDVPQQMMATKANNLRLVSMKSEGEES